MASLGYSEVPSPDNPEKSIMVYTCPVCGSHQEKNRKTTTHGVICAECANRLKDRWGLYTDGHGYTKEQFYALCDNFTSASEIFSTFIVPNPPIVLKPDEYCIYVGEACGGKIKIITTGYIGKSKGYSVRLMKGLTYHSGNSGGQAVRNQVLDSSLPGTFVITNLRFILMTPTCGFEVPVEKIGNIDMDGNTIILYAGSKSHIVITDDIQRVSLMFNLLTETSKEYSQQKQIEESMQKALPTKKSSNKKVESAADEIWKFKQLADEGIITEEEFEMKKRQLLGLE